MIQCKTVLDSFVECELRLIGDINILFTFDAEDLVLVIDLTVHDTVTEGFGYDELHVLGRDVEFLGDVF